MLSHENKINRYELIEQALCNRINDLKTDLAFDFHCTSNEVPFDEWEACVAEKIKQPLDVLFGDEDVAYYLFDKMIEEQTGILSLPPKTVMQILKKEQTGVRSCVLGCH